ncbi:MAG: AAA family ATPase [Pseudomonadota bacterium]|nr:AAA family ATPase [Pseudomonadota bacterium]
MRIASLRVENFKSVGPAVELSALGALEIFHGPNAAGKSNLLLALRAAWSLLRRAPDLLVLRQVIEQAKLADYLEVRGAVFNRRLPSETPCRLRLELVEPALVASFRLQRDETGAVRVTVEELTIEGEAQRPPFTRADPHDDWLEELYVPEDDNPDADAAAFREQELTHWQNRLRERLQSLMAVESNPTLLLLDDRRTPPGKRSWEHLLATLRDSPAAAARLRYRAVVQAMKAFPEAGDGDLTAWREGDAVGVGIEETTTGEVISLDEMGAGVEQVFRLLVAVFGLPSSVVAIEEPELNLSLAVQERMLASLRQAVERGRKQLLLTSHSFAFDGAPTFWEVRRDEQGFTQVERRARQTQGNTLEAYERLVTTQFGCEPEPPAWVTRDGLLKLPDWVRKGLDLKYGEMLFFRFNEHHVLEALTAEQLQAEEEPKA